MKGTISHANRARSRFAVATEKGAYALLEVLNTGALRVGDVVEGALELTGKHVLWRHGHGSICVWVDDVHLEQESAVSWVKRTDRNWLRGLLNGARR